MPLSRTSTETWLRGIWQQRGIAAFLLPVSLLFLAISSIRRLLYRIGILKSSRLHVPVVVIGNITVGGAGKTPLLIHLVRKLESAGYQPGVVSRGYGAVAEHAREVTARSTADEVGDEAVLVKRLTEVPMFVGHDRAAAGRALLLAYPECQLLVCDDGLQHYALCRDVEIAVLDRRGLMNGWLLPAGPLREPATRLTTVDACVLNESSMAIKADVPLFRMKLLSGQFYAAEDATQQCDARSLLGKRLIAFAGIGDPNRFFETLSALGLRFEPRAFDDHHRYTKTDFDVDADAILTTEKDAVKFGSLAALPVWILPVDAVVEPDLARFVLEKINGSAAA